MHIHPALSAFPFALLTMVVSLEVYGLVRPEKRPHRTILINLAAAVLFTAGAFFSGYYARESASQAFSIPDEIISFHHTIGRLLLLLIGPCFGLALICEHGPVNPRLFRALYLAILLTCFLLVLYTGFLGGNLVFSHGAGVSVAPQVLSQ